MILSNQKAYLCVEFDKKRSKIEDLGRELPSQFVCERGVVKRIKKKSKGQKIYLVAVLRGA